MRTSFAKIAVVALFLAAATALLVGQEEQGPNPMELAKAAVQKQFPGATVSDAVPSFAVHMKRNGGTFVVPVDAITGRIITTSPPPVHAVRYGSVIKVKPGALQKYSKLHAAVWPPVLKMITKCNIHNYSIYYKDGYLFSYFEYVGRNFDKDMAKMAADKTTQRWWAVCKPLQQPLKTRKKGEWWASMPELFHED